MATRKPSMLTGNIRPLSGDVFTQPFDEIATNDVWKGLVWTFKDTSTRIGFSGFYTVPENYVGDAELEVIWTTLATTGDVEWDFDYRSTGGNDTESLDQTGNQESVNQNDTAPSTALERMTVVIPLTATNLQAGDTLEWSFFRDGTDVGDGIAAATHIFDILFSYSDA